MIRVMLVDDQAVVRRGLRLYLGSEPDLEVVAEASGGDEVIGTARKVEPDVVLMDIRMPRGDGIAATRELRRRLPNTRVIVLTTFDLDEYIFEALDAGAAGFLLKDAPPEEIINGIREVAQGQGVVAAEITGRVLKEFSRRQPSGARTQTATLSLRETEILEALADGLSNAEIAERLCIEISTVKTHLNRIITKLGLRDRLQLVVWGYRSGIIRP